MHSELLFLPNVSKVPQYSPLRYPGGKSRLYPYIKKWICSFPSKPSRLVEPFAGASHIGLAAAIEDMVEEVLLFDIDEDLSALWSTILCDDCKWLSIKIEQFQMKEEEVNLYLSQNIKTNKERAFQLVLRNRISRAGITAPGAGILFKGENGKGVSSRWYPTTLRGRIERINKAKQKIQFVLADGLKMLKNYSQAQNCIFFIDPPYPMSGRRLYKHFDVNPEHVFALASSVKGSFLMTYEDNPEIETLVSQHSLEARRVSFSTAHNAKKPEFLISRDFTWLDCSD